MPEKKNKEQAIHSSAAEYLTFVASTGDSDTSYEMRYEDENIWLTQSGGNCQEILDSSNRR